MEFIGTGIGFAGPVGSAMGACSSIFIASPLLLFREERKGGHGANKVLAKGGVA